MKLFLYREKLFFCVIAVVLRRMKLMRLTNKSPNDIDANKSPHSWTTALLSGVMLSYCCRQFRALSCVDSNYLIERNYNKHKKKGKRRKRDDKHIRIAQQMKLMMLVNLFPSFLFNWHLNNKNSRHCFQPVKRQQKNKKKKLKVEKATKNRKLSYRNKHNLHWQGFSPLCIRRCFVSVELSENAFLQALHLFF